MVPPMPDRLPDPTIIASIRQEPIELHQLLKREELAQSGGEAKLLIAEGSVLVNGQIETRKRKKIYAGDRVQYGDRVRLVVRSQED